MYYIIRDGTNYTAPDMPYDNMSDMALFESSREQLCKIIQEGINVDLRKIVNFWDEVLNGNLDIAIVEDKTMQQLMDMNKEFIKDALGVTENEKVNKLMEIVFSFLLTGYTSNFDNADKLYPYDDLIVKFTSIVTGIPYQVVTLRGVSQGDAVYCLCPEDTSDEMLSYIEACYFNTGTWYKIIYEPMESEEDAWDSDDYSMEYTHLYSESDIKKWASDMIGCSPNEVIIIDEG